MCVPTCSLHQILHQTSQAFESALILKLCKYSDPEQSGLKYVYFSLRPSSLLDFPYVIDNDLRVLQYHRPCVLHSRLSTPSTKQRSWAGLPVYKYYSRSINTIAGDEFFIGAGSLDHKGPLG